MEFHHHHFESLIFCSNFFCEQHSLYPNCPPLCIPLHIFNCLLKILREESEESKLEQWQNRLATEDTAESIHGGGLGGGASSVDDYGLAEERIDYEEVGVLLLLTF